MPREFGDWFKNQKAKEPETLKEWAKGAVGGDSTSIIGDDGETLNGGNFRIFSSGNVIYSQPPNNIAGPTGPTGGPIKPSLRTNIRVTTKYVHIAIGALNSPVIAASEDYNWNVPGIPTSPYRCNAKLTFHDDVLVAVENV